MRLHCYQNIRFAIERRGFERNRDLSPIERSQQKASVAVHLPLFIYFLKQNVTTLTAQAIIEAVHQDGAMMPEIKPGPGNRHDTLPLFPCADFAGLRKNIERKMHLRMCTQSPCPQVSFHKFATAPAAAEINKLIRRCCLFWRVGA
jgi:hypothetical protein